jgi:hypothetical protein
MNRIFTAIIVAAASAAASWAMRRVLERRSPARPRGQLENWENEGGALAPQHAAVETSQVPR